MYGLPVVAGLMYRDGSQTRQRRGGYGDPLDRDPARVLHDVEKDG